MVQIHLLTISLWACGTVFDSPLSSSLLYQECYSSESPRESYTMQITSMQVLERHGKGSCFTAALDYHSISPFHHLTNLSISPFFPPISPPPQSPPSHIFPLLIPLHTHPLPINHHAPIRMQTLPTDKTTILTRQKNETRRDLARLPGPPHRCPAQLILRITLHCAGDQRRPYWTRADGVAADAVADLLV